MKLAAAFLILTLAAGASATAAERRVLFAINDDGETKTIEPIVLLDPLAEPRMDDDAFARRAFATTKSYIASCNGRTTGRVQPVARVQTGCVSLAASAKLTGEDTAQFATNFEPKAAGSQPREATENELRMLRRWARQFLVARGIAPADAQKLEADVVYFDPGDGVPLFAGSMYASGDLQPRSGAVFFIAAARDVTATRMSVQYAHFSEREPDGPNGAQPLFGTIDLDGDGFAELVTQRIDKEGYGYVVYRRRNGRWIPSTGGGAGC